MLICPLGSINSILRRKSLHFSPEPITIEYLESFASTKSSRNSLGPTGSPRSSDPSSVGVGGCSNLCFTLRARFWNESTMIRIRSVRTCSFSGPKMVDASLMIEWVEYEDRKESAEPAKFRLSGDRTN